MSAETPQTPAAAETQQPSHVSVDQWIAAERKSLEGIEAEAAVNGQLVKYRQVIRSDCDRTIYGQTVGLLSFNLFKTPVVNSQTGKPIYGFVKIRGNWRDVNEATANGADIIKNVDSKFKIHLAPVGQWVPISEDISFIQEQIDVKMKEQDIALRDQAARDKIAEQKKIAAELVEAEERLKNGGDVYDDQESLDFYTMKRVTLHKLQEERDKYIAHLKTIQTKLSETVELLKTLEESHPNYESEWNDNYNKELGRVGIKCHVPNADYVREYYGMIGKPVQPEAGTSGASE